MIEKFDKSTALLLVDVQEGVNDVDITVGRLEKEIMIVQKKICVS